MKQIEGVVNFDPDRRTVGREARTNVYELMFQSCPEHLYFCPEMRKKPFQDIFLASCDIFRTGHIFLLYYSHKTKSQSVQKKFILISLKNLLTNILKYGIIKIQK